MYLFKPHDESRLSEGNGVLAVTFQTWTSSEKDPGGLNSTLLLSFIPLDIIIVKIPTTKAL